MRSTAPRTAAAEPAPGQRLRRASTDPKKFYAADAFFDFDKAVLKQPQSIVDELTSKLQGRTWNLIAVGTPTRSARLYNETATALLNLSRPTARQGIGEPLYTEGKGASSQVRQ